MAIIVWDGSESTDPENGDNWVGGVKPGGSDIGTFSDQGDGNCQFMAGVSWAGINVTADYGGDIDFNGQNITLSGDLVLVGDGTSSIDFSTGDTTVGGDFTYRPSDYAGTPAAAGTLILTGASKALSVYGALRMLVTVSGSYTLAASSGIAQRVTVSGTVTAATSQVGLTIPAGGAVTVTNITVKGATLELDAAGTLTVSGTLNLHAGADLLNDAALSLAGNVLIDDWWSAGSTLIKSDLTLGGNLTLHQSSAACELKMDTYNASLVLQGNVTVGTGCTWTKGTGGILFSGASNQDVDFDGKAVEDIEIDKTAGDFVLTGPVQTDSFTGTDTGTGDFDPNGQTITIDGACDWAAAFLFDLASTCMDGSDWQIGGNFTADGQTLPADNGWDLDVTGTAVASGTGEVSHCTAGGTEIDASAGPWTDSGNNTNWNFGAVAAHRKAGIIGGGILGCAA